MKIYEIGRALPEKKTGMIGLFEFQQAKALNDAGNEVHYIYLDSRSFKVNRRIKKTEMTIEGVRIHGLMFPLGGIPEPFFSKIKSCIYIKLLKKIFNETGIPNVVHIHFPLLSITPDVWEFLKDSGLQTKECKSLGYNLFVTEHWTAVQEKKINVRRLKFLKKIYRESKQFICVSQLLKMSVQELCGGDKDVPVVPNMVADYFYYIGLIKHDGFRFVSAGRLVEVKGFDLLIDAFTNAFRGNEAVTLTIVGGGKLMNSLKKQIANLQMENQINLSGLKTSAEVAEIFRESDCYVSASGLETFGVPLAEAWMLGLPCISADNTPIKEYFSEKNGLLFKINDRESLSETMRKVFNNYEQYDSDQIAAVASRSFSSKNIADKLLKLFQK